MKKRFPNKNRILLVNITRLGDMLQATPTIAGLKLENPDAHITVLVEKQFSEVCNFIPHIDEVLALDLSMVVRSLSREQDGIVDAYEYLSTQVDDLRGRKFDYCLNMSSSAYTALLLNLIGIGRNGGWTADDDGYRRIESDWAKLFATSVYHQNRQYNSLNLVDVFRCSADVEQHPNNLLIKIEENAQQSVKKMLSEAGFNNKGPLLAIQAGASQEKRQWSSQRFIQYIRQLLSDLDARIVLTGTSKEMHIIDPIVTELKSPNVFVAAGKTSIPQLAALLSECDLLVTGDTGPMHIAVAAGTPVIAMFLASAYGYETGPYGTGNIVLQPVIGCGPCNPNKPCSTTECHDLIDPIMLAKLTELRLKSDVMMLPDNLVQPGIIAYRSCFDDLGFYDLTFMHSRYSDPMKVFRDAYRKLWLDDLGGYSFEVNRKPLSRVIDGLDRVIEAGEKGVQIINELEKAIRNTSTSAKVLGELSSNLTELDKSIEDLGFHYGGLGPLTRMFNFAKENLAGSDALALASEMGDVYRGLVRRGKKLGEYYVSS